jgi:hypothetical protein
MLPTNAKRIYAKALYLSSEDKQIDEVINSYLDELPNKAVVIDIKYNVTFSPGNPLPLESALILFKYE